MDGADGVPGPDGAAEIIGIDRTRLARIELDTIAPYPEEVKAIQNLLKENFKLRKYILALNKGLPLRMCPFMDFTQREHKCLIYTSSARPLICKFYTCNQKVLNEDPPESH